ncbi:hypothetical protein [Nocardia sp. NPDC050406]|uniref:hypothetical protein n=1 Tax=Nocardia sp. NPDC050406 TaxID=3364318 RepID=UPI00379A35AC
MSEFRLSPERRAELAALLADERRFRNTYPAVAEYLAAAEQLPGGDGAFDLRLLHYMTGGESANPYWDIVAPSVSLVRGRRVVAGASARLAFAQTVLQAAYAYAVPAPETLEWVVEVSEGRRVLEIGAGRGYWAHLLAERGLDVLAVDREPPDERQNIWFPGTAGQRATWHPVGDLGELAELTGAEWAQCVLLLVWPPGWENAMASEALASYRRAGGDRVVYIGEPRGGKTGDRAFFDALEAEWRVGGRDSGFVSWWNLSDGASCWVR